MGFRRATIGVTRLSVSGNSNSALNGNYYVYNVVDSTSLQVYSANPQGSGVQGGTLTFADGQTVNLSVFPTLGYIAPTGLNMDGANHIASMPAISARSPRFQTVPTRAITANGMFSQFNSMGRPVAALVPGAFI